MKRTVNPLVEASYNFIIQDPKIAESLEGYKKSIIEHYTKAYEKYTEYINEFNELHPLDSFQPCCSESNPSYKSSQRAMWVNAFNKFFLEKMGYDTKAASWSYQNRLVKKSFMYQNRGILIKSESRFNEYVNDLADSEMRSASHELYQRIYKLIGSEPTTIEAITFNANGCYKFSGVFKVTNSESKEFQFKASIVYAGGWNIQRFHVRYVLRLLNK